MTRLATKYGSTDRPITGWTARPMVKTNSCMIRSIPQIAIAGGKSPTFETATTPWCSRPQIHCGRPHWTQPTSHGCFKRINLPPSPVRHFPRCRFIIEPIPRDSIEGLVIRSIVGSTAGLAIGIKRAYDGFESYNAGCRTG